MTILNNHTVGSISTELPKGYKHCDGYTIPEEWSVVRFDGVFDRLRNKNSENNQNVLTISAQQGLISQMDYYNTIYASEDKTGYSLLHRGDFAYNKSYSGDYAYGAIKRLDKYEKGIVSPLYICFTPKKDVNSDYFAQYFEAGCFDREIYKIAQEGARNHGLLNVSTEEFFSSSVVLPPISEQNRIADILVNYDALIKLEKDRICELEKQKEFLLNEMFPTAGNDVPNIRFPEYIEPWGNMRFSEFTFDAGKRNKYDLPYEPYAITNDRGFIPQNEAHDDFGYMQDVDRKMYIIVKPDSFAYNPARINVGSIGYYEGTANVLVSSLYEVFQTKDYIDNRFLWHWFKTKTFQKWIERLQEGSVRLYFYYDKLCECKMMVPSLDEQRKIGVFFDNLDKVIAQHYAKINEMKQEKKFLMHMLLTGAIRVNVEH